MTQISGKTADGVLTWAYTGDVVDGKRHGNGRCVYDNDDVYSGEWKDDRWHGEGELTTEYDYHTTVRHYKGQFADGAFNGRGVGKKSRIVFAENYSEAYDGEWKDGAPHGKGTMIGRGGSIRGEWEGNKPKPGAAMTILTSDGEEYYSGALTAELHFTGMGKLTKRDDESETITTSTDWFANEPKGSGTYYFKDKEIIFDFKGELNGHKCIGSAKVKTFNPDGSTLLEYEYEGEASGVHPHGKGRRVFPDGKVEEGTFEWGDFMP